MAAIQQLLDSDPNIDGVSVANDFMADGALRALRQGGRRVPDDVAVVGFDDIELARFTEPRSPRSGGRSCHAGAGARLQPRVGAGRPHAQRGEDRGHERARHTEGPPPCRRQERGVLGEPQDMVAERPGGLTPKAR